MNILREHWDRVAGWSCVALGALAIVIGWFGVSGTEYPAEQLSYIASGGLGGIFLLGLGTTLVLSADLRDEWVLVHRLTQDQDDDRGHDPTANGVGPNHVADDGRPDLTEHLEVTPDTLEAVR